MMNCLIRRPIHWIPPVPLYSFVGTLFMCLVFGICWVARTLAVIVCHTCMFYTLLDIFSTKGKFMFHSPEIHNSFSLHIQFSELIFQLREIYVFFLLSFVNPIHTKLVFSHLELAGEKKKNANIEMKHIRHNFFFFAYSKRKPHNFSIN